MVIASEGDSIAASVLPFSPTEIAAANHPHELHPTGDWFVSLDARQCGLGNSSCGPGVLEKYAVPPAPYSLDLSFRPVASGERTVDVARQVIPWKP